MYKRSVVIIYHPWFPFRRDPVYPCPRRVGDNVYKQCCNLVDLKASFSALCQAGRNITDLDKYRVLVLCDSSLPALRHLRQSLHKNAYNVLWSMSTNDRTLTDRKSRIYLEQIQEIVISCSTIWHVVCSFLKDMLPLACTRYLYTHRMKMRMIMYFSCCWKCLHLFVQFFTMSIGLCNPQQEIIFCRCFFHFAKISQHSN